MAMIGKPDPSAVAAMGHAIQADKAARMWLEMHIRDASAKIGPRRAMTVARMTVAALEGRAVALYDAAGNPAP